MTVLGNSGCVIRRFEEERTKVLEKAIADLIEVIKLMVQAEQAACDFYRACAEFFEHDHVFWISLSDDESLHVEVLTQMLKMIKRKPHDFEPGTLFSAADLRDFISRVHSDREKVMTGTLATVDALITAHEIETTVIEANYTETLGSANPKYVEALNNLRTATVRHKGKIEKKMKEYKTRGIPLT